MGPLAGNAEMYSQIQIHNFLKQSKLNQNILNLRDKATEAAMASKGGFILTRDNEEISSASMGIKTTIEESSEQVSSLNNDINSIRKDSEEEVEPLPSTKRQRLLPRDDQEIQSFKNVINSTKEDRTL